MMAACTAAEKGASVTLLEKSRRCGMKLGITGKGRCNLTNKTDKEGLMKNTVCNGKFLYSAFSSMSSDDTIDFFEHLGLKTKVERGNRVFPASDRALDVVGCLMDRMRALGVKTVKTRAQSIKTENGRVCGVSSEAGFFEADAVILCTGGLSYPATGSDGDGYEMAKKLGHHVTELKPSLVSLTLSGDEPARLEGLSLKNVAVSVVCASVTLYSDFGEMLFTSKGVSGPVILSSSSYIASKGSLPCRLDIDLKPALSARELDARILKDFEQEKNRDFSNSLGRLLPSKIIPVIIERCGIPPETKVNSITRTQRANLVSVLKQLSFEVVSTGGFNEAVVTCGGIDVREIDPKTLGSKKIRGLFFAGEIIDVDALTGGYNLQIAWSTGRKAALSAAEEEV